MEATVEKTFLDYSSRKLQQLSSRIETCLGQLNDEQVWMRGSENENSIGNLTLHLCGNVRQWIVAGVGGKADVRQRDVEFAARGGILPRELQERLRAVTGEALTTIGAVTPARLLERVVIQKYDVTVLEAVYHVVEHFSTHAGQILFATKMLTGSGLGFHQHLNSSHTDQAAHGEKTP